MKKFNTPTAIVLWPKSSPVIEMVSAKFYEQFPFEADPSGVPDELKGATCVEIGSGVVRSFVEPSVNRSLWKDPLEEQDLVMIADGSPTTNYIKCRDLLNFVVPVKTNSVVTFAAQPNAELEASCRITVAVALQRDVQRLEKRVELYQGRRIAGPAGIMLGVAAELDQSAFCIVIEHAPDAQYVSSLTIKAAMLAFARATEFDTYRGQMSEQSVRMHKHLKQLARRQNQRYHEQQANGFLPCNSEGLCFDASQSIEDELRMKENIEWIEQLFGGISNKNDELDHSRKVFLKSELDRLGLFHRFEKRFLGLWSKSID